MKNYFIIAIIMMLAMTANKSFAQINRFFTLEECKQDTSLYLYKNYVESDYFTNVPMSKVLKASKSLPFKSIVIDSQGGGVLQFFLFYVDTKQVKEYKDNQKIYFVACMPESDISPSYHVEEYKKIKEFGIDVFQDLSLELETVLKDCLIGYTHISYDYSETFKKKIKQTEEQ